MRLAMNTEVQGTEIFYHTIYRIFLYPLGTFSIGKIVRKLIVPGTAEVMHLEILTCRLGQLLNQLA